MVNFQFCCASFFILMATAEFCGISSLYQGALGEHGGWGETFWLWMYLNLGVNGGKRNSAN
jgi:hypothetical protein